MSEKRESLPKRMWGSLVSPRKTFESIQGNDLRRGFLIIAIIALISAWAEYNYAFKLPMPQIPGLGPNGGFINQSTFRSNFAILLAIGSSLGVVINWLVLSMLIHLTARLVIGSGGFKKMLALMGFASTPVIIQQALRLIDSYTVSEQTLLSLSRASSPTQSLGTLFISNVISVFTVFGIWAFLLALTAVSVNYGTSRRRASAATISAYILLILIGTVLPI